MRTSSSLRVRALSSAVALSVIAGLFLVQQAGAAPGIDFQDGFESGDLSAWTKNTGLVAQQSDVFAGAWAARAQGSGTKANAFETLPTALTEISFRMRFKLISNAQKTTLVKLQLAGGTVIGLVGFNPDGTLFRQNKAISGGTRNSGINVRDGAWHAIEVHLRTGSAGLFEVSLDGAVVAALTGSESVGTAGIGKVNLGESQSGRSFHMVFDDVVIDDEGSGPPGPDGQDPSAPGNLRTTTLIATRVVLAWNASSDNVGVAGYRIYRDSELLDTTTATTFSDDTVAASTTYDYAVEAFDAAGNTASSSLQVTTPGGGGGGETIVLRTAGDIACDPADPSFDDPSLKRCAHRATADLLDGADAVIAIGDLQYDQGSLADYNASYDPSWGAYKAITYPAAGDGEYETPGAAGYFAYWGARAHQSSDGYYSVDLGAWHVVILNSQCNAVGGCNASSPQAQWLEDDLQANSSQCTLAALHVPVFASRTKTDRQVNDTYKPFFDLLDQYEAEIVIDGNSHFYERFAPQNANGVATSTGVREFLVGTGGKSIGGLSNTVRLPTSQVGSKEGAGVLELRLSASSYEWEFLPVPGNSFTDSGSTGCH
ncbi:MAG: hypothetical protein ACRDGK_06905 [Actinomycetota bacterium]